MSQYVLLSGAPTEIEILKKKQFKLQTHFNISDISFEKGISSF